MDVSYCTLPAVVILGVIGGIPLTYVCLPYLKKACKHVFTDRPMSLGPLVSIAQARRWWAMCGWCPGESAKASQPATQVASSTICTCGCGRHK